MCGWVGSDNGVQASFLFRCRILLDRDIWVVRDAQRAMPSAVFFFFHSPFSISGPSLLPPAISSSLTVWITHRACLLSFSTWLYPLRGQVGIRTGGHSFLVQGLNYGRVAKTVSTILRSPPPRRLFHLDDSCLAPGYHHSTLHALSLFLHSQTLYRRCLLFVVMRGYMPCQYSVLLLFVVV